jgi:hypothetical protein
MKFGNLYTLDDRPLADQVTAAITHFQHKHGVAPTAVHIHPDNVADAPLEVIADSRQGKASFELVVDSKNTPRLNT